MQAAGVPANGRRRRCYSFDWARWRPMTPSRAAPIARRSGSPGTICSAASTTFSARPRRRSACTPQPVGRNSERHARWRTAVVPSVLAAGACSRSPYRCSGSGERRTRSARCRGCCVRRPRRQRSSAGARSSVEQRRASGSGVPRATLRLRCRPTSGARSACRRYRRGRRRHRSRAS